MNLVPLLWGIALLAPCTRAMAQGGCEPAVIVEVVSNAPLCPGDTLQLSVITEGDVLGHFWQGPNTPKYFTVEPWYSFAQPALGTYAVVVYGPCGTDTALVNITAQGAGAGQDSTLHVCSGAPPLDLGAALGFHAEGGTWTHNGIPHTGTYVPGTDLPGIYLYTAPFPATCPGTSPCAAITVTETALGGNSSIEVCEGDAPFPLLSALDPGAQGGGNWYRVVFLGFMPHPEIYDPNSDSSGTFRYERNGCQVFVTVDEAPLLPWYTDEDGDGYGNPAAWVPGCVQPPGTVADSSDNCAHLPGRIGDPCDDGNPGTIDDLITDSCTCAGLLPTSVAAWPRAAELRVWPNPAIGRRLFVQADATGPALLQLFDARSGLCGEYFLVLGKEPVALELPGNLAQGLYTLLFTAGATRSVRSLAVP